MRFQLVFPVICLKHRNIDVSTLKSVAPDLAIIKRRISTRDICRQRALSEVAFLVAYVTLGNCRSSHLQP